MANEEQSAAARAHGYYLPTGEFLWRQPLRAYEPGANGRVGPGNLLRYCEIVANAASAAAGFDPQWYADRGEGWVIYRQNMELAAPIGLGAVIDLMTWVRSYTRVTALRDYVLQRADDGAPVVRATTTWAYVARDTQSPRRIPPEIVNRLPHVAHTALRERPAWGQAPAAPPPVATYTLRARGYEADTLKHINNCVYADWLGEAAAQALPRWADAIDPQLAAFAAQPVVPRHLTINYLRSALPGDEIVITTTPARVGSRGVALAQTITRRDAPETPIVTATTSYFATIA